MLSSAQDLGCAFQNAAIPGCPRIKQCKMINKAGRICVCVEGTVNHFKNALTDKNVLLNHGAREK